MSTGALVVVDEHVTGGETQAFNEFGEETMMEVSSTGWSYPDGPSMYGTISGRLLRTEVA